MLFFFNPLGFLTKTLIYFSRLQRVRGTFGLDDKRIQGFSWKKKRYTSCNT